MHDFRLFRVRKQSDVVPYSPRFQDGWSPGVVSFVEFQHEQPTKQRSNLSSINNNGVVRPKKSSNTTAAAPHSDYSNSSSSSSSSCADDNVFQQRPLSSVASFSGSANFDEYRDELMATGAQIALVTCSREGQNVKELTILKGEYLEVKLYTQKVLIPN
jgi:hypothetical protein